MWVVISLVVLAANFASGFLNGACTAYVDSRRSEIISVIGVEICKTGEIYWNYPKGEGKVIFRSTAGEFEICITPGLGGFQAYTRTDTNEVFTLSDHGDKAICMRSKKQQIPITVTADDMLYYMSDSKYEISMI